MQEEIPLSHNDSRKFPADESTEELSVANVGAVRSVSLQEEEMFNESAHYRPGRWSNRPSEAETRSSAISSPVRERKAQNRSRSDEERNRYIKDTVDSRKGRTTPEYRDNGYKERCSNKYQDERGSNRHSASEDQRRRLIHSDSQDLQQARSRNERQQQRPNSETCVKKRIATPTDQDDRLAYRRGENCRGKCSRDETPPSSSPVFYDANSTSGSSKCKESSRPVSSGEESDDNAERGSRRSRYDEDSRGSCSGYHSQPKQHTSDRDISSKPQNYIEDAQRYCMERKKCQAACEAQCNREFFRSKTVIPPWQTRGPANMSRCYGQMEDPSHLADRQCYPSRKYEQSGTGPMDYQQRVDCVGSSNNYEAVGPSSVNNCFPMTSMPSRPPTDYLSCFQNTSQPSYVQPQGNCVYPNYEMPVSYNNQPFAMPSMYGNQPVGMPCNCVNQPVAPPLFNSCPKVDIQSQSCPPMQVAGFYKDNCHDGNSWNENQISQGCMPGYPQDRRVPRAWFRQQHNDDSDKR